MDKSIYWQMYSVYKKTEFSIQNENISNDLIRKVWVHTCLYLLRVYCLEIINFPTVYYIVHYPRANGAKRRSGRKPGARVTNFALGKFKVIARGS